MARLGTGVADGWLRGWVGVADPVADSGSGATDQELASMAGVGSGGGNGVAVAAVALGAGDYGGRT